MREFLLSGVRLPYPLYSPPGEGDGAEGAGDDSNKGSGDAGAGGAGTGSGEGGAGAGGAVAAAEKGAEGAAGEDKDPGADAGADKEGEPKAKADWRDRELNRKHAQLKEREKQLEEARAENARLKAAGEKPAGEGDRGEPQRSGYRTEAEFNAAVDLRAEELATGKTVQKQIDDTQASGLKAHGEKWGQAINQLALLGFNDAMLPDILATDDPVKVIYEMGSNPEEAQRIMALPEARRRTEFVKLALPATAKGNAPKPSGAPAPVNQVGGRSAADTSALEDALPEDEWRRRRAEQKRNSVGRAWSTQRRA